MKKLNQLREAVNEAQYAYSDACRSYRSQCYQGATWSVLDDLWQRSNVLLKERNDAEARYMNELARRS